MESDINHIYFLICYIPRLSISQIVRRLKQESTCQLWLLHYSILCQYYWYRKILWSNGFFVCSIGEASPDTISSIHSFIRLIHYLYALHPIHAKVMNGFYGIFYKFFINPFILTLILRIFNL